MFLSFSYFLIIEFDKIAQLTFIIKTMKEVILVWKRSNWHEYSSHQQRFSITFCSAINWFSFIIAIMQTLYVVKGQEVYKKMAKFWTQLFLINFAVGVVTGILQNFSLV